MMRFLTDADALRALTMAQAIAAVRGAFLELDRGGLVMPPRTCLEGPARGDLTYFMPALSRARDLLAQKIVAVRPSNPSAGLPLIQATVSLARGSTGQCLAVLEAGYLTALRTGAASGLATDLLARPGSRVLGVIGAGVQARTQIWAVASVRPIGEVRVYSPRLAEEWDGLATFLGPRVSARLVPVSSARAAVEGADVVVLATTSRRPVIEWGWIAAGAHVNATGSHTPETRELDTETVAHSRVVCDSLEACLAEAGDLILPRREGAVAEEHYCLELADLVAGRAAGRSSPSEVTVFKSVGLALEDLAVAASVYERSLAE